MNWINCLLLWGFLATQSLKQMRPTMSTAIRETRGKYNLGVTKSLSHNCLSTFWFILVIFNMEKGLHLCPTHTSDYGRWAREARGIFFFGCTGSSLKSGGYSSLRCTGFSSWWLLLSRNVGSRCAGSGVAAHGLSSCGTKVYLPPASPARPQPPACGILPDQGLNPRSLHWQVDSHSLCHQESPKIVQFLT